MQRLAFLVLCCALTTTARAACPTFTTRFEVVTLPGIPSGFGPDETEGTDLNDAGEAVGAAFVVDSEIAWRAVRWGAGATSPLELSEGMGRAYGIAEDGIATGQGDAGGAIWSATGAETLLDLPRTMAARWVPTSTRTGSSSDGRAPRSICIRSRGSTGRPSTSWRMCRTPRSG